MSLAIFDLDNTLIAGDSDHLWGEFLVENQCVDKKEFRRRNDQFYLDYQEGALDIHAYLCFSLEPLSRYSAIELQSLHRQFMEQIIAPLMLPKARALTAKHRDQGDRLLIITATNRFVAAPIAKALGIPELLASEPEIIGGCYTGKPAGVPCYQDGKVTRLKTWLTEHDVNLKDSYFYSDSANDIPLLQFVDNPVAVDPDNRLRNYAVEHHIPIISLR